MADATPVIDVRQVTKIYETGALQVAALRGVDLTIGAGDYVAITGPSGSGKSTLMHILGCLDTPSSGTYRLAGEDVSAMDERELASVRNRRIGFVFQQFHLLRTLTAIRNVELPFLYAPISRKERYDRAAAAMELVGLADRMNHRPNELSGGQQQRVAIARALAGEPDLLLADEPTGNLDTASTADILALFEGLYASGRTVVLITHEQDVAAQARRAIAIRDGVISADALSQPSAVTR